jgi:hypothetical protein
MTTKVFIIGEKIVIINNLVTIVRLLQKLYSSVFNIGPHLKACFRPLDAKNSLKV